MSLPDRWTTLFVEGMHEATLLRLIAERLGWGDGRGLEPVKSNLFARRGDAFTLAKDGGGLRIYTVKGTGQFSTKANKDLTKEAQKLEKAAIGWVLDGDVFVDGAAGAVQAIRSAYPDLIPPDLSAGEVHAGPTRVGVWVSPDNVRAGSTDELLWAALSEAYPALAQAAEAFAAVPEVTRTLRAAVDRHAGLPSETAPPLPQESALFKLRNGVTLAPWSPASSLATALDVRHADLFAMIPDAFRPLAEFLGSLTSR